MNRVPGKPTTNFARHVALTLKQATMKRVRRKCVKVAPFYVSQQEAEKYECDHWDEDTHNNLLSNLTTELKAYHR